MIHLTHLYNPHLNYLFTNHPFNFCVSLEPQATWNRMALETATYISDLNTSNPSAGDGLNQGDDHLRLVKTVLKNTFPNVTSAVNANQTNLNNGFVPIGGIILWSGSVASIPANWALCNGGSGTPNLTDRFVVAAGASYTPGNTGGSATTSSNGSHSHGGVTGDTALTYLQVPNTPAGLSELGFETFNAGPAQGHHHSISADGTHTHTVLPPYYALAYIMRTG